MARRSTIRDSSVIFQPSVYTTGLQPVSALASRAPAGREYGFSPSGYLWDKITGSDDKQSVFVEYWWAFLLATPFVYVGVNMALDSFRKVSPAQDAKK
jgi:hypothetical protein